MVETIQDWDPERYARNARFVSDLGQPVVALLAPKPGESILDLGCGDGALTEALVAAGARVVGVDASGEQVAAALSRGIDARVMDGMGLDFHQEFDAVFSNAAMHWMRDLSGVVRGVAEALKPNGRFVGEMGGSGNVRMVEDAIRAALSRRGLDAGAVYPWVFPTVQEFRHLLEEGGFRAEMVDLIPRPTPLPGDIAGWLETFAETFLKQVPERDRDTLIAEIRSLLAPKLRAADGTWTVDYVRLRFSAVKEAAGKGKAR
ncbi:MAG: methyltransferase domain-containing protein [Rhodospirillales bacterium]|nr:methyltransferase domain-containing protein [Rhodospirillales bacterium]